MLLLALIKNSLMLLAMQRSLRLTIDVHHEMTIVGVAQMATGCLATFGSSPMTAANMLIKDMGASKKVPSCLSIGLMLFCCVTSFRFVAFVPKFVFTSMLFAQSLGLLHDWVVSTYKRMYLPEWIIILVIAVTMTFVGLLQGVSLGFFISILLFAHSFLKVPAIKYQTNLAHYRSSVDRWPSAAKVLDEHGPEVVIFQLQGFLFFGNAVSIATAVKSLYGPQEVLDDVQRGRAQISQEAPLAIILDFNMVYNIDGSATEVLKQIMDTVDQCNSDIIVCTVHVKRVQTMLSHASRLSKCHVAFVQDLDEAVATAEEKLLARYITKLRVGKGTDKFLAGNEPKVTAAEYLKYMTAKADTDKFDGRSLSGASLSSLDGLSSFCKTLNMVSRRHLGIDAERLMDLDERTVEVHLEAGDQLKAHVQNTPILPDADDIGLFFIESGVMKVQRVREQQAQLFSPSLRGGDSLRGGTPLDVGYVPLATIGPGWVIGSEEVASRRASLGVVTAQTPCRLHFLAMREITEVEASDPRLALALFQVVARLNSCISNRLKFHLVCRDEAMKSLPSSVTRARLDPALTPNFDRVMRNSE
uniref:STAS domain-containing protein n=1 Tax=Octactis speculum TaxID=3111310 RepID=A0A7S2DGI3_9STRA